ncbi:MAG TPA: hypothetical protein VG323_14835, partial [Thermoanaerobaculia bacterium]|nr:hypothetical protein [Thermoanaerobaculia bacterium]
DETAMEAIVRSVAAGELTREDVRKQTAAPKKTAGRPKNYVWQVKEKSFRLNLAFRKPNVEKREIVDALRELIRKLESEA